MSKLADLAIGIEKPIERSPDYEYGTILPYRKNIKTKKVEWSPQYSELVKGAIDAFSAPGRALMGQIEPNSLQGVLEANNLAQMMMEGGFAQSAVNQLKGGKNPQSTLKMFAGESAKTADFDKLKLAKALAEKGVPDEQIWKQTGWTKGFADKKWRFEIPDDTAKQLKNAKKTGMIDLEDWISHPELQKAYPRMFDRKFAGMRGEGGILAMAEPGHKGGEFGWNMLKVAGDTKGDARKSITLHELQHAIQQREGFARGGSPEQFKVSANAMQGLHSYDDMIGAERILQQAKQHGLSIKDYMNKPPRWVTDKQLAIAKQFEFRPEADFKYAKEYVLGAHDPMDAYRLLAGESEARLTQARMNMTPAQRAESYPPSMFDVPVDQQIVRYGDGVNEKLTEALNRINQK